MEIHERSTVSPPHDETEYEIKIIDYGQGNKQLSLTPVGERSSGYNFAITNEKLLECQWRDTETAVPTPILRAVEYYGYHVTDVVDRPTHGLYQNVSYLREAVESIGDDLPESDVLARSGVNWASESLDLLGKLELLRAHLTKAEFDIVLFKAQQTSADQSSGNLTVPTATNRASVSLKSVVIHMLAFAQHDGYLDREILDPDVVERLVRGPDNA